MNLKGRLTKALSDALDNPTVQQTLAGAARNAIASTTPETMAKIAKAALNAKDGPKN